MIWRSHRWLTLAAAAACAATVSAQQGAVRGQVFDKDFDAPLPGVTITVTETGQTAQTSDQGNFSIPQLPAGQYTLVFAKDGYVRQLRQVAVVSGRLEEVSVSLAGDFTDGEEFIVQEVLQLGGSSEESLLALRFESPALMDSVGADLMKRAGASDAASALRLVAGASLQNGKSAVIRGLPDRYVSSQLNGVRLPTADEDKRAVELDQFPSEVIESIQVSKTFTPDQQGDASGGAVDVRLKGVPNEPFFIRYKGQTGRNTQVSGRNDFLTYEGGGLTTFGRGTNSRAPQFDNLGDNWDGAVGTTTGAAPIDYKLSGAIGGSFELGNGWRAGGMLSVFYERDSSYYDKGVDDSWVVETPGQPMSPKTIQGTPQDGDFKTALFDVTRGKQSVQWSELATAGIENENHKFNIVHLHTHSAEDSATLAEDTRGKQYYYPGYDPADPNSPGFYQFNSAPYVRLQTLEYTERTTDTLQFSGHHRFALSALGDDLAPELDWTLAKSSAKSDQPDKRQFGSLWTPGFEVGSLVFPPSYVGYKPGAVFTLGNLQRIYKVIEEDSEQANFNFKVPFRLGEQQKGYFKFGWFQDRVKRSFDQDTYSNFSDNSGFNGPWEQYWSNVFPYESHPISESEFDVDYKGRLRVDATYAMLDLPLLDSLSLVGGVRWESTEIGIVNDAESFATWFPPGSSSVTQLNPGDADVDFSQDDVLPSIGLVFTPVDKWTLRMSYSETIARQTFKELTPILQQEYAGGPIFIGNPDLQMSQMHNYDVRLDYAPYEGSLLSTSFFHKDIDGPIEYVQRISSFDYTTPVNYPTGDLQGWEFEARQGLGRLWGVLDGVGVGANATFLHSKVELPEDEQLAFSDPQIGVPTSSRAMTDAPDHLYNFFVTWDVAATGTQLGLFYTITGDTLIAGAGESNGRFVPSVYATETDRLNFSLSQALGRGVSLQFQAKNLTDPDIQTTYRGETIGPDVVKTSYREGIDYTLSISGEIRF
ncbi:MAG: TonB-dependent receptor [Planctomycetes bacterium]|nr:TonB-dependent receptor [Planctomycetota bacterium]